jgi:hypothetical protein
MPNKPTGRPRGRPPTPVAERWGRVKLTKEAKERSMQATREAHRRAVLPRVLVSREAREQQWLDTYYAACEERKRRKEDMG